MNHALIAGITQAATIAATTAPVVVHKLAPAYDIFASLAAFSAAIAIAYGSLPNFRHREQIRNYVREKVDRQGIIGILKSNVDAHLNNQEPWSILYRLGDLGSVPNTVAPDRDAAKNFGKRPDVRLFSWLYMTNLDKMLAIALGSVSATVVWFGALDRSHFSDPAIGGPLRADFFSGVFSFYFIIGMLCLFATIVHRILCWRLVEIDGGRRKALYYMNLGIVLIFVVMIVLSDINIFLFPSIGHFALALPKGLLSGTLENWMFRSTKILLMGSLFVPLFLLWKGNQLSDEMEREVDEQIQLLAGEAVAEGTKQADILGGLLADAQDDDYDELPL